MTRTTERWLEKIDQYWGQSNWGEEIPKDEEVNNEPPTNVTATAPPIPPCQKPNIKTPVNHAVPICPLCDCPMRCRPAGRGDYFMDAPPIRNAKGFAT